jgi:hypothetical protein
MDPGLPTVGPRALDRHARGAGLARHGPAGVELRPERRLRRCVDRGGRAGLGSRAVPDPRAPRRRRRRPGHPAAGRLLHVPLAVAPTSMQRAMHAGGEVAMSAGATAAGCLHVVSSNSGTPFDRIGGGPWWLQAYQTPDRDEFLSVLEAAVSAGARAVVLGRSTLYALTVDGEPGVQRGPHRPRHGAPGGARAGRLPHPRRRGGPAGAVSGPGHATPICVAAGDPILFSSVARVRREARPSGRASGPEVTTPALNETLHRVELLRV